MRILMSLICLTLFGVHAGARTQDFELTDAQRRAALEAIGSFEGLRPDDPKTLVELHRRAHDLAALLGPDSLHAAELARALASTGALESLSRVERSEILRDVLVTCRQDLAFRPTMEAERPKGFPGFTTVGELEVKRYPRHRLARTAMPALLGETRGFWTLFEHIKSNEIAMTAPVEMRYDQSEELKPLTMSFLYGDEKIGKPGRDGDVEVMDIQAMTVISMGFRGLDRDARIEEASRTLDAWLIRNADRFERAGDLRVMGWNSPSVRGKKRYFEVQIPIKPKNSD